MADASKQQTVAQRVWAEARRSVFYGVIVLLVALVVFGTFVKSMPKFKVGNARRRQRGPAGSGIRALPTPPRALAPRLRLAMMPPPCCPSPLMARLPPRAGRGAVRADGELPSQGPAER